MAHLEVEPKKSSPWLWIILGLVILAVLFYLLKGNNGKGAGAASDSTTTVKDSTTTTTTTTDTGAAKQTVAVTEPDWSKVDFNAPKTTDPDITDKDVNVSGNDQYTIYSLGQDVLFASGQTTLQGSAEVKLKQIVAALGKRYKNASIGVYGSTDATGDAAKNKQLGADRANAVKEWLTKNGIDSNKVSVQSLGEKEPVATNATATGRQQNRNVSIVAFPAK